MKADMKVMVKMMVLSSDMSSGSAVKTAGGKVKKTAEMSAVPCTHNMFQRRHRYLFL